MREARAQPRPRLVRTSEYFSFFTPSDGGRRKSSPSTQNPCRTGESPAATARGLTQTHGSRDPDDLYIPFRVAVLPSLWRAFQKRSMHASLAVSLSSNETDEATFAALSPIDRK